MIYKPVKKSIWYYKLTFTHHTQETPSCLQSNASKYRCTGGSNDQTVCENLHMQIIIKTAGSGLYIPNKLRHTQKNIKPSYKSHYSSSNTPELHLEGTQFESQHGQ
jgi:hypothetical protein